MPLRIDREYDSSRRIDGPLGYGWSGSFGARLYYATYLYAAPSTYLTEADILMPDGLLYRFVQNGDGTFQPPATRHDTLVRNADGSFELTLQRTLSKYRFGGDGGLTSMTDDYGNALNFVRDGSGRVERVEDGAGSGRFFTVTWGPDGRVSIVQDSAGRTVQYFYNAQGALASVTDPAGRSTSYSYSSGRFAPRLSRIADNWGRVITDVTYDAVDRVSSYTEQGEMYTYAYNYGGNPTVTAKTDSSGNRTIYTVPSGAFIGDVTPPAGAGGQLHTDYYQNGLVQQTIDEVGVKTYFTYDAQGNTTTVTRDYQGATAVRFDYSYDQNFPTKVTAITPKNPATNQVDPNWQAWQYDYYQLGSPAPGALYHVYRVRDDGVTLDTTATYEYDSHGRVTKQTSPTGGMTDFAYDAAGNLVTVTAPSNNDAGLRPVTTYSYDALGRVASITDALNHATTYTYDALDRVASVTLPKPTPGSPLNFLTSYGYDNFDSPSGLIFTATTDPNGGVTKQSYDQFGQLVKTTDALGNVTTYAYTRGLLTSLTDANGNVTAYGYDSGHRLTSTTFPDGAVERYTYTADNLLYQKTDRKNQTITYSYDRLKRLNQKTYPGATSIAYTYQGQKLTQVVDTSVSPTETHTFGYDSAYRASSDTQGSRGTISYQYNPDDTVLSYSVQGGPTATRTYYPDSSLDTIAWSPMSSNFKYAYTLAGQYQTITFPNGQTRNYTYDEQGRLVQLSNLAFGGGNLATYAYGYDLNYTTGAYTMVGQRVSMTATVPSQGLSNHLTRYEYDSLYQLNKVTYPNVAPLNGEVDSWTYDAIGNRLTSTVNGTPQTYTYQKIGANPNNWQRLLSDGTNPYTYDANGSTATKTGLAFGWSYDNRLTGISGSTVASYGYDHQGRRTTKTTASTSRYVYDGLNLVQEQGSAPADYLFGPGIDEPLAMYKGGAVTYFNADSLGSVVASNDTSGSVTHSALYDAWGTQRSETGTRNHPFTYTGREVGEAGTLFYRARYYSPNIRRFLSDDPLPGSVPTQDGQQSPLPAISSPAAVVWLNFARPERRYNYGNNDPAVFKDPLGLYGTTNCSYYNDQCKNSPVCSTYYCSMAPRVCRLAGKSKWANCTRQCLQDFERHFDCARRRSCPIPHPENSPLDQPHYCNACIVDAHTFCYLHCFDSPDTPPIFRPPLN